MPNLVREDINDTHAKLTLTISREDYEEAYTKELKKQQKQSNIKGFRPGKAPLSYLMKVAGTPILARLISEQVEKLIAEFQSEHSALLVDMPQFASDSPLYDFEGSNLKEFDFRFDAFFLPDFELQGIEASDKYEMLVCDVTDEMVQEQVTKFLSGKGKSVPTKEPIAPGDYLFFDVRELQNGELAEDGVQTTISVLFNNIADEDLKKSLEGKSIGYNTKINVFELEKDRTKEFVLRNILGLSADEVEDRESELEGWFDATVSSIERVELPEITEEFLREELPDVEGVTDEEGFRKLIREDLTRHYESQYSMPLLRDQFIDRFLDMNRPLVEVNPLMVESRIEGEVENMTAEELEKLREDITHRLKNTILLRKSGNLFDINITSEDVVNSIYSKYAGYFGRDVSGNPQLMEFVTSMVKRALDNEDEVRAAESQVLIYKVFDAAKERIGIDKKAMSADELRNAVDEFYNNASEEAEEEETAAGDSEE